MAKRLQPTMSAALLASLCLGLAGNAAAQERSASERSVADRHPVVARHDMVAAANPLAAEAGREMLRRGGRAIDAEIAMQMVVKLVEPQSSGIGGGAFLP